MFLPDWSLWWVLLTLLEWACCLEISGNYNDAVICSQGLSRCTMKDQMSFPALEDDTVDVHKVTPHFKLCCKDKALCRLCLVIDTELYVRRRKGMGEEGYNHEKRKTKASMTVCYKTPSTFPTCKKVKFTVHRAAFTQQNPAKISMVLTKPDGVFLSSEISVYPSKSLNLSQQAVAPSEVEVCTREEERVEECQSKKKIPRLSHVVYRGMDYVELQFAGRNESLPSICIQFEKNGPCQIWKRTMIPLHSVTPCMCLQVWDEQESLWRLLTCPFKNKGPSVHVSLKEHIQRNVWQNVSVSVRHVNNYNTMLWWNLSAPCKLEGEVWPCEQENTCKEEKGSRQQLGNGSWKLNSKGLWEKEGVFENVSLHLVPCVMVKLKGLGPELGPFCFKNTGRWRLLLVAVTLLVCFAVLIFYFLNYFIKKCGQSGHHARFLKLGRKGHVVLLSPPDVDDGVSESVCQLGSLLWSCGLSMSVDQWSRKEQCSLGPLPWLHSQLLKLSSLGGRVVLILTHKALVRTAEWTHQLPPDDDHAQASWSPYSDVFTACLCLIKIEKQLGRAAKRFLLVTLDSPSNSDRSLPELLQGLPLYQLPSQTHALLAELCVGGRKRRLSGTTWCPLDAWRARSGFPPAEGNTM